MARPRTFIARSAITALLLSGCVGSTEMEAPDDDVGGDPLARFPTTALVCPKDPDCGAAGTCDVFECADYWLCEDLSGGTGKRCVNPGPDFPSDGAWECHDEVSRTVCTGSEFPADTGGSPWNCERQGEFVVCTDDTPNFPDQPGDGPWNCYFDGEFRICDSGGDGTADGEWQCHDTAVGATCRRQHDSYPADGEWDCYVNNSTGKLVCSGHSDGEFPGGPGDATFVCETMNEFAVCETDFDYPEYPGGAGDSPWDCAIADEFAVCTETPEGPPDGGEDVCVPNKQRWCDDAVYCSWGKQTCLPDGRWGPCIEPTVDENGLQDRPNTACGCRYFYFNEECCETDDCVIPEGHTPPACVNATDGRECAYCDSHNDCGGTNDLCIFAQDGRAFCGSDCSSTGCPDGYECSTILGSGGTFKQCLPSGGQCE